MQAVSLPDLPSHLQLLEQQRGGLKVWRWPEKHQRFAIGIDSSAGLTYGDWACACVIETSSKDLFAAWRGKYESADWGVLCAGLGTIYNTAMLGFETHPSPHGLASCLAARATGYPMIYRRQRADVVNAQAGDALGFWTNEQTKGLLLNRVRVALREDDAIFSEELLTELKTGKIEDNTKVEFSGHNDLFMAYGIALWVADVCVKEGFVSSGDDKPLDWQGRWWAYRREMNAGKPGQPPRGIRPYDGT